MKKIRKGDEVMVVAGKDKGRRGTVQRLEDDRVLVDGVNVVRKHGKVIRWAPKERIVDQERPVHLSNVAIFNPHTSKPDRVGVRYLEDDAKVRYFNQRRSGRR